MKQEKMSEEDIYSQQHRMLARFATLLGAFRLKSMPERDHLTTNDDCISTLFSKKAFCSAPSLSLSSSEYYVTNNNEDDKHQIEEHAALNLARPIVASNVESSTNSTSRSEKYSGLLSLDELPPTMLNNLGESFLTLVDARLRVYITILARHGINLSECPATSGESLEQKLSTLIDVGTGVRIENLVTLFNVKEKTEDCEENRKHVKMPFLMEVTMDVSIPCLGDNVELITIEASTEGLMEALCDDNVKLLHKVIVEVDTHKLLSDLVDRASIVMSKAVDSVLAANTFPSNVSKALLPKNVYENILATFKTEAIPSQHSAMRLVSPDIAPKLVEPGVEPFQLDEEAAIDKLSPQKCANIVDFVIGEVSWREDDIAFPKFKKQRTTAT